MTLAPAVQPRFTLVAAVGSDDIAAAQQAVLVGQQHVDQTRSAAAAALDSATNVCAAVGADVDPSDPAGATSTIQACQAALQRVVDAQGAVADAQRDLASRGVGARRPARPVRQRPPVDGHHRGADDERGPDDHRARRRRRCDHHHHGAAEP